MYTESGHDGKRHRSTDIIKRYDMWNVLNASFADVSIVLHNMVIYYSYVYRVAYLLLKTTWGRR